MTEQQRVLLAVGLTFIIFWVWQVILGEIDPPVIQPSFEEVAAETELQLGAESPIEEKVAANTNSEIGNLGLEQPIDEATAAPVIVQKQSASLHSDLLDVSISNEGAALNHIQLKHYTEKLDDEAPATAVSLARVASGEANQARLLFTVNGVAEKIPLVLEKGGRKASLRGQSASGLSVVIDVATREAQYGLDYALRLSNQGSIALITQAVVEMGLPQPTTTSSMFAPSMQEYRGICGTPDEVESYDLSDTEEGPVSATQPVFWAGLDKQYFVVAASLPTGQTGRCEVQSQNETISVTLDLGVTTLAPGAAVDKSFSLYLGPKREDKLEEVNPSLREVIEYNIMGIPLAFIARPMIWAMNIFHGFTGSWGIAIILLTLSVKSLLFPVTYKSVVSMRKMQLLKPELDKIKARYPDDREKQQTEQIRIFKEKGVNPLGGCLPMLLQMPVWFALYRALWTAVDLYQQPFLWIADLTAKEPFPFLALGLGAVTFLQQKKTTTTMDSDQARMMMIMMPIMLTVFMIALPSGLVLYIFVNSVLTIGQQLVINKRVPVPK